MSEMRYASLRDYLRVLRANWIAIVAVTVLGGVVAYIVSSRQATTYEATAQVSFQDPSQLLSELTGGTPNPVAPEQTLASSQQTIDSAAIAARVQRRLGSAFTVDGLRSAASVSVDPSSGVVDVTGKAGSGGVAAAIANGFARQGARRANLGARAKFGAAAARDQRRVRRLGSRSPEAVLLADQINHLTFLAHNAEPARVVATASPPSSPSSPHTRRDTAIGLVAGLALGILVAFFRDSLDHRLRSADEIERELRLPIVGYVHREAMGAMPGPEANGRPAELEAFRILRENLAAVAEQGARSVLVTSAVAGEGKSTVAASLAGALALAGHRTLLVDGDLRRGELGSRLGVEPSSGLADYLAGNADLERVARAVRLDGDGDGDGDGGAAGGLWFVGGAGKARRAPEVLSAERARALAGDASRSYDSLVVDSSPLLPVADALPMLGAVGCVLLCVRAGAATREEARAARAALDRFGVRSAAVVVTGLRRRDERDYGYHSPAEA